MQTIEPHCVSDDFSIMPYGRLDDVLAMNAKIHEREVIIVATTAAQVNYWARIIQAEIADRPPRPRVLVRSQRTLSMVSDTGLFALAQTSHRTRQ